MPCAHVWMLRLLAGGISLRQFLDFYCLHLDRDFIPLLFSLPLLSQSMLLVVQRHPEQQFHSVLITVQFL